MLISRKVLYQIMVLARPNRPKNEYWSDGTDRNMSIGQNEQSEIWVLARPSRPKYGYCPDRTDRNMGIGQTEQTKIAIGQRNVRPKFFSDHWVGLHRTPLSATQVDVANTCLGSRTSPWHPG